MAPKTALILGAGKNIGAAVAKTLKGEGYSVALVSRKPDPKAAEAAGYTAFSADVAKADSVKAVFKEVGEKLGTPSVVVFNAAAFTFPTDPTDPFSAGAEAFAADVAVNSVGGFIALQEAVAAFKTLDDSTPKVFIATGNVLPFKPNVFAGTLGAAKAVLAHLVEVSVEAFGAKGYRFYFASQVSKDGNTVNYPELSGEAHAKVYAELLAEKEQGPWEVRFTGDTLRWKEDEAKAALKNF
ncbi:putative short-chain dehydrogenase [Mytilinidion resinicola]|uniref:Short-chain dehydrogenase n=1 Tax=Mytilinidion resinicola TaxID=574789 RepID=A0A6A6YYV9_9PEZI|nr:putative short-chain dehydrogenase [Mytilinidion resinicola]KAF2813940.1 putative short-chain dehydrogenase [Mytilinidion resinicola]